MSYPLPTSINGTEGFTAVFTYTNLVSDGWFSNMIIISLYMIVLIGFYKATNDFAGGMAVSGFFCFILSLLFWLADVINGITFSISIAMSILGVLVLLINRK